MHFFKNKNRSQFVQSLLLSTLSIIDESDADDQNSSTLENIATVPEQMGEDCVANTMSFDTVTSNAPMAARTSNSDEAKKKQESASHSDLDSHPQHLSGNLCCCSHQFEICTTVKKNTLSNRKFPVVLK